ncbi:erythromycin esterase family protein [Undibacterium cyanobacteriorum]|uniref:Erythromycin esterase family protein n=1 Tax=Undibacterium cyanobacteriorum TaxID=3073561 RepID=A0ABY9RHU4_9BURK|nr:erythromycin esterase family protein [Undibacterium sp. 20NA77.5]WMW80796.1 erythromycin esterase family protein [Undibacterium sp. 20NA77.5]
MSTLFALMLVACGGSGSGQVSSPTSSVNTTPTASVVDLTQAKLLSDSELSSNPFPNLPPPPADEMAWLQSHHHKIRSLKYDQDFSDLSFLEHLLNGKRIVQLGESSHGTREFSQAKVRLIKYLHEKLGYNVIAFESSTIGCYMQELELAQGRSFPVNQSCIFGVWSSREVQDLFTYIEQTRKTNKPLYLAGFDEQYSNQFDQANLVKSWAQTAITQIDDPALKVLPTVLDQGTQIGQLGVNCVTDKASPDCASFFASYQSKAAELANLAQALTPYIERATGSNKQTLEMLQLVTINLQKRLEVTKQNYDRVGYLEPRDRVMADNITTLANRIYPQEKIMVWAHNGHISHSISGYVDTGRTMGSFLAATWGPQLYSIGLFMLRGETANNDRSIVQVQPLLGNSIETYAASLHLAAVFIPFPAQNQIGSGDDWLFRPINFYTWGKYPSQAPITEQFNAVLVIDHSSMPDYVR